MEKLTLRKVLNDINNDSDIKDITYKMNELINSYADDSKEYEHYYVTIDKLNMMINSLLSLDTKENNNVIKIDKIDETTYDSYYFGDEKTELSLDFADWKDIIDAEIDNEILNEFGKNNLISIVLTDLCYSGFTYENSRKSMESLMKSLKEASENSKDLEPMTFEEFMKSLENEE